MSSDLIALGVALMLGAAVVVLGLRRNLSETTRDGLPRFGGDPEGATPTLGLYEGEETRPRSLSPRQQRWLVALYLLLALSQAASAVSGDDWLIHAALAALVVFGVVVPLLRKLRHPSGTT